MNPKQAYDRGFLAAALLVVGAQAVHWFLTPMAHPDATDLRTGMAALQCVLGIGGGLWLLRARFGGGLTGVSS